MKLPKENPPRLPGENAIYEDDPFELGDIDESKLVPISKSLFSSSEKFIFKNPKRQLKVSTNKYSPHILRDAPRKK